MADPGPCVGIFWKVSTAMGSVLLADATPLPLAEPYGDCLTHPRSHYEVWEAWRAGLTWDPRQLIPSAVCESEYEEHPRGRIVFHRPSAAFWIYADHRLWNSADVATIHAAFNLTTEATELHSDFHYR